MYTTKVVVEFTVQTQFGPLDAVNMIDHLTRRVPAINSRKVVSVDTDYIPLTPQDFNRTVMNRNIFELPFHPNK